MNEWDMAVRVAFCIWWKTTSISDGAHAVLRSIYASHEFSDGIDVNGLCGRCGHIRSDKIHIAE